MAEDMMLQLQNGCIPATAKDQKIELPEAQIGIFALPVAKSSIIKYQLRLHQASVAIAAAQFLLK